jgi:hypothetical protein
LPASSGMFLTYLCSATFSMQQSKASPCLRTHHTLQKGLAAIFRGHVAAAAC